MRMMAGETLTFANRLVHRFQVRILAHLVTVLAQPHRGHEQLMLLARGVWIVAVRALRAAFRVVPLGTVVIVMTIQAAGSRSVGARELVLALVLVAEVAVALGRRWVHVALAEQPRVAAGGHAPDVQAEAARSTVTRDATSGLPSRLRNGEDC